MATVYTMCKFAGKNTHWGPIEMTKASDKLLHWWNTMYYGH